MAARYGRSSDSQMARTVPWVADAGLGGDAGGDLVGPGPQLGAVDDLGDEPDLQRGRGGDPLVVAHQRDAQRLGQADLAHEADRLEGARPGRR